MSIERYKQWPCIYKMLDNTMDNNLAADYINAYIITALSKMQLSDGQIKLALMFYDKLTRHNNNIEPLNKLIVMELLVDYSENELDQIDKYMPDMLALDIGAEYNKYTLNNPITPRGYSKFKELLNKTGQEQSIYQNEYIIKTVCELDKASIEPAHQFYSALVYLLSIKSNDTSLILDLLVRLIK